MSHDIVTSQFQKNVNQSECLKLVLVSIGILNSDVRLLITHLNYIKAVKIIYAWPPLLQVRDHFRMQVACLGSHQAFRWRYWLINANALSVSPEDATKNDIKYEYAQVCIPAVSETAGKLAGLH